jgi:hypothetical protein
MKNDEIKKYNPTFCPVSKLCKFLKPIKSFSNPNINLPTVFSNLIQNINNIPQENNLKSTLQKNRNFFPRTPYICYIPSLSTSSIQSAGKNGGCKEHVSQLAT